MTDTITDNTATFQAASRAYEEISENRDLTNKERIAAYDAIEIILGEVAGLAQLDEAVQAMPQWLHDGLPRNPDHTPMSERRSTKPPKSQKAVASAAAVKAKPVPTGTIDIDQVREAVRLAYEDVSHRSDLTDQQRPDVYEGIETLAVMVMMESNQPDLLVPSGTPDNDPVPTWRRECRLRRDTDIR